MTYAELELIGRQMGAEQVREQLLLLSTDPRFAAVIALLEQHKEAFAVAGSAQNIAADHGKLAHCQGSVFALRQLQDTLKGMFRPQPKAKAMGDAPPA